MKLRNHIPPVICLMVALASLFGESATVAQVAYPVTPFMPPARQCLVSGRFYIQTGLQFRNIQRWGFEKSTRQLSFDEPVQDPHNPGVYYTGGRPPFGPNQEGNFGTGTGVPGYQEFGPPTGNPAQDPRQSGIWIYDDGYITPNGFTGDTPPVPLLWPNVGGEQVPGLGQFRSTPNGFDAGLWVVSSTSLQVGTGGDQIYPGEPNNPGFDPSHPPNKTTTFNIFWHRVMDDTVAVFPERGVPSRIWKAWAGEIRDANTTEEIWTPAVEIGFQWTNLFDFFYSFSWFSLEKNLSRQFTSRAELWRRGFLDTFPFWSDDATPWNPGAFESNVRPNGQNVNQQILPDSHGTGGFPRRTFFQQADPAGAAQLPPVTSTETIVARTSAMVYENKLGARSWTPLYGMGRLGVTAGALINLISYQTSQTSVEAFTSSFFPPAPPAPAGFPVTTDAVSRQGSLFSFGLFTGVDVEIDYCNYFLKTMAQYSISEEKQLQNSQHVWTNLNLGGFSSLVAGGVRF